MKRTLLQATLTILVLTGAVRGALAEEGVIGGADLGVMVPMGKLDDRLDMGGVVAPYAGYMFTDAFGLVGQAQVFGATDRPGNPDGDGAAALAATVGPRLDLPFDGRRKPGVGGGRSPILYLTGQVGGLTGLAGSSFSGTTWGYSVGGGMEFRLNDEFLLGPFMRYNWFDEKVTGARSERGNIKYITAGLGLTYNLAPPPAAVAAAPAPPPVPVPPPPAKKKIVLRGVQFDYDKSDIRKDARPVLDEAIATLKQEGGVAVISEGHTDSRGSDEYNQKLSLRRAQAVRDYLVAGGIGAGRVTFEGFGESRPVASNDTDDGRAQNRRVELRISGQ